jgi:hypothetical protein
MSATTTERPTHALASREVARVLATDATSGLAEAEAAIRLARHGPNRPRGTHRPPYLRLVRSQIFDPLVLLLVAATAVSIAIGDVVEGAAIAAVLAVNAALGFWQELSAERAADVPQFPAHVRQARARKRCPDHLALPAPGALLAQGHNGHLRPLGARRTEASGCEDGGCVSSLTPRCGTGTPPVLSRVLRHPQRAMSDCVTK